MAKLVVVHKTLENDVPKVVAHLENRCLHPTVLDESETMSAYRRSANEIRIAVPETEQDMAVRILDQMQRQEHLLAIPAIKKANATFLLIAAALIVLIVLLLLDIDQMYILAIEGCLVAIAAISLIRRAWRRNTDDSSADEPEHGKQE